MADSSNYITPDKFLSDEECTLFLERVANCKPKIRLALLVLYYTGVRVSECLNLETDDLRFNRGSIIVKGTKGSKDREVALPREIILELLSLKKGTLFRIGYRWLEQKFKQVMPGKHMHSLRHTFAVRLYRQTRDIRLVQYALGHKNIRNTMIYTDIDLADDLHRVLLKQYA